MKILNKKGFTLIELLAVIAILAILLFLVTPNILGMFTKARADGFKQQIQSVYRTAQNSYMNDIVSGTAGPYCSGDNGTPLSTNLSYDNLEYYVSFDNNAKVTKLIVVDKNNGFYYDSEETKEERNGKEIAIDSVKPGELSNGQKIADFEINCSDGTLKKTKE